MTDYFDKMYLFECESKNKIMKYTKYFFIYIFM